MVKKRTLGAKAAGIPAHVMSVHIPSEETIALVVNVSEKSGVKTASFAFGGVPVPVHTDGHGPFSAVPGVSKKLQWVMLGDPGGTMKVTVTRDGTEIETREKSTIPPGVGVGYDYFDIKVS